MNNKKKLLIILLLLSTTTLAQCFIQITKSKGKGVDFQTDIIDPLQEIGSAAGALLLVIQGLKWSSSTSAEEKENAKQGVIYILIGVFLVYSGGEIILYVICA